MQRAVMGAAQTGLLEHLFTLRKQLGKRMEDEIHALLQLLVPKV
jgi:hypothetical protein